MAQQIVTTLIDDLDGSEATVTVQVGLNGAWYEIDLSDKNADALNVALAPYLKAGRRVASPGKAARIATTARPSTLSGRYERSKDLAQVRAWAREQGYEVSDRGRVSGKVMAAYEAACA